MSAATGPAPSAADRLSRLLALVPWLLAHQGVALGDAARHFAITEDQLVHDLELLFVCGTPGHLPDDLIEAEWTDLQLLTAEITGAEITLQFSREEIELERFPAGRMTRDRFPGLHR